MTSKRGNKIENIFGRKFLIGFLIVCFGLMIIFLNVPKVRGAEQVVQQNIIDTNNDGIDDSNQQNINQDKAEKQLNSKGNVKLDGDGKFGSKVDGDTLKSKDGKTSVKGLENAPEGTNVKLNSDGSMDISGKNAAGSYTQHVNPGSSYDFSSGSAGGQSVTNGPGGTTQTFPNGQGPNAPRASLKGEGGCSSCGGAGSGGEGGGSSAAGGGSSKTPQMDSALQSTMSALGYVGQLGLKADSFKKQPNAPELWLPQSSVAEASVDNGATATVTDGTKDTSLAQNDKTKTGWIKGNSLKDFDTGNSVIAIYGSVDLIFDTPDKTTHVKNDLSKDLPVPDSSEKTSGNKGALAGILPLVSADEITGEAVLSNEAQHIDLVGQNIDMGGEKIGVYILRPFDHISGKGTYLNIENGESYLEFRGPKTYYNREIPGTNFFVNRFQNEYDLKNSFKLVPGGKKGNYLIDGEKVLTVGDAVVSNPLTGYENLSIPKSREAMWKKAVEELV